MKIKMTAVVILGGLATAFLVLWSRQRYERACNMANEQAELMYQMSDFVAALEHIDRVDSHCRCARFTSGDTPPQYSLALACLRKLSSHGRSTEAEFILTHARGPILVELANSWPAFQ